MNWWSDNRLRLIQNNLRETDANLDVEARFMKLACGLLPDSISVKHTSRYPC
jgi:hypothetical protein